MAITNRFQRFEARAGLQPRPGPAVARHEISHFLRRLILLMALITALVLGGAAALAAFEDVSYWRGFLWALDTIATIGSIPDPDTLGGQITKIFLITFG